MPAEELEKEVERLRAEKAQLLAEIEGRKVTKGGVSRRLLVGAAAFLAGLLIALTATVGWAHRVLLNTDVWVKTVAPIGNDPRITDALAQRTTAELFEVIDVQAIATEALPERAAVLAVPLSSAVQDFVGEQVQAVLRSDRFGELWIEANRFAHAQFVAILRNEGDVLDITEGKATLNLLPIINDALARIEERASGLLGRDINIPEITSGEVPEAARQKLSDALGRELPSDFGEVVVFESDKLAAAQNAVAAFDRALWVLVLLTVLLIVGALWFSYTRRRTIIQIAAVSFVSLIVIRRIVIWGQAAVIDVVKPENRGAARALVDYVFTNFFTFTTLLLWLATAIVVIVLITGPYPSARTFRARSWALMSSLGDNAARRVEDEDARRWVHDHRDLLLLAGIVPAVLLLLVFDLNWFMFLLVVAVLGVFELAVVRLSSEPMGPTQTRAG